MRKINVFRDLHAIEREERKKIAETLRDPAVIFTAAETQTYASNLVASMTGRHGKRKLSVRIGYEPNNKDIGWTTPTQIFVNAGSDMINGFAELTDKVDAAHGVLFHEIAHQVYMDFDAHKQAQKAISNGQLYGPIPTATAANEAYLTSMLDMVKDPKFQPFFVKMVNELHNRISDQHDEDRMIRDYHGYPESCLWKCRERLASSAPTLDKMESSDLYSASDKTVELTLLLARFGEVVVVDPELKKTSRIYQQMMLVKPDIDRAVAADSADEIFGAINATLLAVWEILVKEIMENQRENQNSGGQDQQNTASSQGGNDGQQQSSAPSQGESGSRQQSSASSQGGNDGQQQGSASSQGESGGQQQGSASSQSGGGGQQQGSAPSQGESGSQQQSSASSQNGGGGQQQGSASSQGKSGNQQQGSASSQSGSDGQQQGPASTNTDGMSQQSPSLDDIKAAINGMTDKEITDLIHSVEKAAKQIGGTREPDGSGSGVGHKSGVPVEAKDVASTSAEKIIAAIVNDIADSKVEDNAINAANEELVELAKTAGISSAHNNILLRFNRSMDVGAAEYNRISTEQRPILKSLIRQMEAVFKEMQLGAKKRHELMGRNFVARDAYRLDALCFETKKQWSDEPSIAIAVLVDRSGSMKGERIRSAQKAGVLIYDLCRHFNVPCMVCGHRAKDSISCSVDVFSDFRRINNDEKRVAAGLSPSRLESGPSNRDGMAIQVVMSFLEKRPEPVKLMMVISDGQPNHTDYRGDAAMEDIRQTVRKYQKRGISTMAFAIGQDKDRIKTIYGESFVDISNLNEMPKKLARIVKREIIRATR